MSMPGLRKLQKKDAAQVALLIKQLTQNINDPKNLEKRIATLPLQKTSQFFVAEVGGKLVGFGGLAWYLIPSKGLVGWVEELVVDGKNRRQGIGKALMEKIVALAEAKKIKQVKLTSTKPAKSLYEKLGFTKKDHDYMVKKEL